MSQRGELGESQGVRICEIAQKKRWEGKRSADSQVDPWVCCEAFSWSRLFDRPCTFMHAVFDLSTWFGKSMDNAKTGGLQREASDG